MSIWECLNNWQKEGDMRIVTDRVGEVRQRDSEGRKVYTLWDLYHHADFVTYPSTYEVLEMPYSGRSISSLCLLTGTLFLFGILSPKDFVF